MEIYWFEFSVYYLICCVISFRALLLQLRLRNTAANCVPIKMMVFWKCAYSTGLQFPTVNVLLLLEEVFHYEAFEGFTSIANISCICFCFL